MIFLRSFIFEKKHIFIDEIIKFFIEFSYHGPHFFINFINLNLAEIADFVLFVRETFCNNIRVPVGEEFRLIFLWDSACFHTFLTIWTYGLSWTASLKRFGYWPRLNFIDVFITFHFLLVGFFVLCGRFRRNYWLTSW